MITTNSNSEAIQHHETYVDKVNNADKGDGDHRLHAHMEIMQFILRFLTIIAEADPRKKTIYEFFQKTSPNG